MSAFIARLDCNRCPFYVCSVLCQQNTLESTNFQFCVRHVPKKICVKLVYKSIRVRTFCRSNTHVHIRVTCLLDCIATLQSNMTLIQGASRAFRDTCRVIKYQTLSINWSMQCILGTTSEPTDIRSEVWSGYLVKLAYGAAWKSVIQEAKCCQI